MNQPYPNQPGQPGQPYPQQPMAGGMKPEHPQGTTILVMGLLGWFVCPILAIVGFFMGNKARKEIKAGQYAETGSVTAGWAISLIICILWVVAVIPIFLFTVVFAGAVGAAAVDVAAMGEWSTAQAETSTVYDALENYKAENGEYPDSLDQLTGISTTDAYGNAYKYTKEGDSFTLICLGADGAEGGERKNTDIVFESGEGMTSTDWTTNYNSQYDNWDATSEPDGAEDATIDDDPTTTPDGTEGDGTEGDGTEGDGTEGDGTEGDDAEGDTPGDGE